MLVLHNLKTLDSIASLQTFNLLLTSPHVSSTNIMSSANNPLSLTYPTSGESKSKTHKHFATLHDLKRGYVPEGPLQFLFFNSKLVCQISLDHIYGKWQRTYGKLIKGENLTAQKFWNRENGWNYKKKLKSIKLGTSTAEQAFIMGSFFSSLILSLVLFICRSLLLIF